VRYRLRYFFDAGSGTCLWAGNDNARGRFGYPVDHCLLPLSDNTRRWLTHVVAWYDTSLDWSNPGSSEDVWTDEELARFNAAADRALKLLVSELPNTDYEIVDERAAI